MAERSPEHRSVSAAGEIGTIPVVKLSTRNFVAWKSSINACLALKSLHSVISDPQVGQQDRSLELRARMVILASLDETAQERVQGCYTAYSMYQRILTLYGGAEVRNVGGLLRKFFSMKKQTKDTMAEHFTKMDGVRLALERVNQPLSDEIFMNQVILSLPAGYEVLREIWDVTPTEQRTIEELLGRICKREADLKLSEDSSALVMKKMSVAERKKITKCAKCGLKGHWAKECETKPEDYVKKEQSNSKDSKQFSLLTRSSAL